jgi:hypothetical protein
MARRKKARALVLFVLGALVVTGTDMAYWVFMDRWK